MQFHYVLLFCLCLSSIIFPVSNSVILFLNSLFLMRNLLFIFFSFTKKGANIPIITKKMIITINMVVPDDSSWWAHPDNSPWWELTSINTGESLHISLYLISPTSYSNVFEIPGGQVISFMKTSDDVIARESPTQVQLSLQASVSMQLCSVGIAVWLVFKSLNNI